MRERERCSSPVSKRSKKTVDAQAEQVAKLSAQLEKSYQKVEDIAVKAIEGSSNLKSLSNLQQMMMSGQVKKQE
ncbi:MAG TPA: hypothetical protein P5308_08480 [Syntrophales bacterium]|nr:hypothetical protein [Syntrophales bacterium]